MYSKLLAIAAMAIGLAQAHPVKVHPLPLKGLKWNELEITKQNTLNATSVHPNVIGRPNAANGPAAPLPFEFVNNFPGAINAYVTGLDDSGAIFFLQSDGNFFFPPNPAAGIPPSPITGDIAIPVAQGASVTVNLDGFISSGRVWFAAGDLQFFVNNGANGPALVEPSAVNPDDPSAGVNWGFVELTWNADEIFGNISYVDFVGLVISMLLATASGTSQTAKGLPADAVTTICNGLQSQAATDGAPWDQLCVLGTNGAPLRVLAPNNIGGGPDAAFGDYWTNYVNDVYSQYTNNPLTIDTQTSTGDINGQVDSTGTLQFAAAGSFPKPGAGDIFGCNSGPFANSGDAAHLAVVPRLCAAFNRATLLLSGGNEQPNDTPNPSQYYTTSPTNHYSRIVHATELDGRGYAFAYDDVSPDGGVDQSGAVVDPSPTKLTFTIGGP